ncbi:MAG: hypothetical protein WC516_01750 [Patescibacteria group bacterium]
MEGFNVKISKISLESNNSIIGEAFISKPDKELLKRLGCLMGIIELVDLPDNFIDGFIQIISDLKTEYYLPPFENDYAVEKRFEECLSRANRRINKLVNESIEAVDLSNINVLTCLSHQDKIFISQIGRNQAFLFHRKNRYNSLIIDILAQSGERRAKTNQEKMFSNIISGSISERDSVFFCNDFVLGYLSQNEISEIIAERNYYMAAQEIEKILTEQDQENNFYGLIIQPEQREKIITTSALSVADETESENYTPGPIPVRVAKPAVPSQHSINRLLNTQAKTERYLAPSLMPNWKKVLLLSGLYGKKISFFLGIKIGQGSKIIGHLVVKLAKRTSKSLPASSGKQISSVPQKTLPDKEPATETAAPIAPQLSKSPEIESKSSLTDPNDDKNSHIDQNQLDGDDATKPLLYRSQTAEKKSAPATLSPAKILGGLKSVKFRQLFAFKEYSSIGHNLNIFINGRIEKFLNLRKIQQVLLIIAFILIFLFSESIVWIGRSAENQNRKYTLDTQTTVQQINDRINEAEAQNIFNDEVGAKASLKNAKDLLAKIPDKKKYRQIRNDLTAKINNLDQILQKIVYVDSLKEIVDLSKNNTVVQAVGLTKVGSNILAFDNNSQSLYSVTAAGQITAHNLPGISGITQLKALDAKNIVLFDGVQKFYKYNLDKKTATTTLVSKDIVKSFDCYLGRLYTLPQSGNQIYKYSLVKDKFGVGSPTFKAAQGIKDLIAMGVGGGIFTINKTGSIKQFIQSKAQNITFQSVDPNLVQTKQISSFDSSNLIFIFDPANSRVVVYDKKGILKKQYSSPIISQANSMVVMEKEKKIYFLAGNKIYSLGLDF